MALPEVSLVFLLRSGADGLEVLLGDQLEGRDRGRLAGVALALDGDEDPRDAAVRGVAQRIGVGIEASDLREAGTIDHHFPTRPAWSQRWYPLADIPYARMRADAARWLPGVLRGGSVDSRFTFGADLATVVLEAS